MELERLKGKTIDGYGLNVSREEALVIIKSLTSQLLCGVNVGREEWSIKGAEYFSIFVDDLKVPSDEYWEEAERHEIELMGGAPDHLLDRAYYSLLEKSKKEGK